MPDAPCDCTYDQWLDSWFLADIADDEISPGGAVQLYWCDLPASTEISYLTRLLLAPREALARYSNAQLNAGFWELVGASGILSHVCGKSNFPDSSLACLTGIVTLFREVFAERCAQGLGHLDEPGRNPLNSICYMWWDIFPVAIGAGEWTECDALFLEVLGALLSIDHDAVRESELHGLGHVSGRRELASALIDSYLVTNPRIRPELRRYALSARAGCIQ